MRYHYVAAALFAVYYFRRYWLTPWGTYVRHTETKAGGVFMVVRHVRWYPPFLSFERTFHRLSCSRFWIEEGTGWRPSSSGPDRQSRLTSMLDAARAREAETAELSK